MKSIPALNPGGTLSKSVEEKDYKELNKQIKSKNIYKAAITILKVYVLLQLGFLLDLVECQLLHSSCRIISSFIIIRSLSKLIFLHDEKIQSKNKECFH